MQLKFNTAARSDAAEWGIRQLRVQSWLLGFLDEPRFQEDTEIATDHQRPRTIQAVRSRSSFSEIVKEISRKRGVVPYRLGSASALVIGGNLCVLLEPGLVLEYQEA